MRTAKFASSFYPSSKEELEIMLDSYTKSNPKNIKGLIVPHAGYIYSGNIAGAGYSLLDKVKKAVLLGPSHQIGFYGVALDNEDYWKIPLGKVKLFNVNIENDLFKEMPMAHLYEHSLEVQVPFLQKINNKIEIFPLVIGEINNTDAKEIAKVLLEKCEDCIFIFSSDLSHFFNEEKQKKIDDKTIKIIENLDFNKLDEIDACGKYPILIAMNMCKIKSWKIKLIEKGNSAEASKDKDNVVGYASFMIY